MDLVRLFRYFYSVYIPIKDGRLCLPFMPGQSRRIATLFGLGNCIASSDVRDSNAHYDETIIAQLYNTREFEYTSIYYNPVRIIRLTTKSRVVMWGERE